MSIFEAIILGLVQGLTEFIPVSSSGHLVLFRDLFGASENGLTFDVALHFGTLIALLAYFHKDIMLLIRGIFGRGPYSKLAKWIALATIPAVAVGVLLGEAAESTFRSSSLVAVNLIIVGMAMIVAERISKNFQTKTGLEKVSGKQAMVIGVAQAIALVPGVSRSGSTITAGLLLGLDRVSATRFSFLLAAPIMVGATAKVLLGEQALSQINSELSLFSAGMIAALLSGLVAINFLLKFLASHSLATFAYYRIGLGLIVLLVAFL